MHAVLFRQWKRRVKGRDWYDFAWFVQRGTSLNLNHLQQRAIESGHWNEKETLDRTKFTLLLKSRITRLNIESAKTDIARFIENPNELAIWSSKYFLDLMDHIKFS